MDVRRDFQHRPPKEPLESLAAFVRDFQWRFPRDRRDMVVEYCRDADNFRLAVNRACDSLNALGKMHNHQSRVAYDARYKFGSAILGYMREREWRMTIDAMEGEQPSPRAFDRLHDRFDELKPKGIGPVTVYDVAVRVGAYLGVEPQSLYLHAGVRQGWLSIQLALVGVGHPIDAESAAKLAAIRREARGDYITRDGWPEPLKVLTADEAEDFCCTYREEIRRYRSMSGKLRLT